MTSVVRSTYWLGQSLSQDYARFRPNQPGAIADAVVHFMNAADIANLRNRVVDVGCGAGQSSEIWADHFDEVIGVDVSKTQIHTARETCKAANVQFHEASYDALSPVVGDRSCGLVACCQAVHWFDLSKFYAEVDRVLKPGGVLAITLYQTPFTSREDVNGIFMKLYHHLWDTGCWDERRRWVESCYEQVALPYPEQIIRRNAPEFRCSKTMSIIDFCGYLGTISAVKTYREKFGDEKCDETLQDIYKSLLGTVEQGEESRPVLEFTYPYSLLMCRKPATVAQI